MIFRIYYNIKGGHAHMRMFSGPHDGALGMCGHLRMRAAEFFEFIGRCDQCIEFRREQREEIEK